MHKDVNRVVSTIGSPSFHGNGYKFATGTPGHVLLPKNLSQLNQYICSPLKRKGFLCSEYADGFGLSVTLFRNRCVNCTNAWHGVPLFLFLEFVPITVFYLIIVVFQISFTSPPMPCLIICSQFVVIAF